MKIATCLLIVSLAACPLLAQRVPEDELGFNAQKLYDFNEVDSVNVYNGNLTIVIPLGLRYTVSPTLSYQFNLVFNGKMWDVESFDCLDGDLDPYDRCERMLPNLRSNAGLGWRLSIGRLIPPTGPTVDNSSLERSDWVYEGVAGDEHSFFDFAGSSLRLVRINDITREVEFPSGEVQKYVLEHHAWRLKEIRDRFGSSVTIEYEYEPAPNERRARTWNVTDSVGRIHTVELQHDSAMNETLDYGMQVETVTLDGYLGHDLTYVLQHESSPTSASCGREARHTAPRLTSIARPDGTSYGFQYDGTSNCYEGTLKKMTLPTGGSAEYTYHGIGYADPEEPCSMAVSSIGTQAVASRTLSDANGSARQWQYVRTAGPIIPLQQGADPCWPPDDSNYYTGRYWMRTSLLSPLDANNQRTRTDHYFNIYAEQPGEPDERANPFPGKDVLHYGFPGVIGMPQPAAARLLAPTDPLATDVSAADDPNDPEPRFLTSQVFEKCNSAGDCTNGTLLQSKYTRYASQCVWNCSNWQVVSERTVWNTDTGCGGRECFTQFDYSLPNGVGRFGKTTLKSNFPGSTVIVSETETDYAAWTTTDYTNTARKWLLDLYSEKRHTAGSVTARTKFDFDPDTGFLKGTRVLSGASLAADDVLTIFKRTAPSPRTELHQVKSYGGHAGGLSTTSAFPVPSTGLDYLFTQTLVNGILTRAQYLQPSESCRDAADTACVSLLTVADRDVDASSGLVTISRDVSGIATQYDYHDDGRLRTVSPAGAASLHYAYTNATTSANARVVETAKDRSQSILRTSTFEFDGLGRVKRASSTTAKGEVATVQTDYDAFGRKSRISQPVESTTHPTSNVGVDWTTLEYDGLGRQKRIAGPDSSITRFAYTGGRRLDRIVEGVATSPSGTTEATTSEYYDAEGRLTRVEEYAKNTSATATTGGRSTTTYQYDIGGRLNTVTTTDGAITQSRVFTYDKRGFLTTEQHPESGTTTYSEHDARGHALKQASGGRTLRLEYDAAERLKSASEEVITNGQPALRPLKVFDFATANAGADLRKGKLTTAVRHNYLDWADEIIVTETYEYATTTGQVSKRTTLVQSRNGNTTDIQRFVLDHEEYDEFRLPKKIDMPTCSLNGCASAAGLTDVTFERPRGFLTSIPGFATIGYHPSGMVQTVTHSSNPAATDTYEAAKQLPRPTLITFSGGSTCPSVTASSITSPASACSSSTGNTASVPARTGITHRWQISGGTITSATTGESITFTSGVSGTVTLTVLAANHCGSTAASTSTVAVIARPAATITGAHPQSIERGASASIQVSLTGTGPWTITWSDNVVEPDLTNANHVRSVTPETTRSYSVTSVVANGCTNSTAGTSITITVRPPPPGWVEASTLDHRTVSIAWPAVSGASSYQIERTTSLGAAATWTTRVLGTETAYVDEAPPSNVPVTYVYYVRTVDSAGTLSDRGAWDFATAATVLGESITARRTYVRSAQVAELRHAIDTLRAALLLPSAFSSHSPPSGLVRAADWIALVAALDGARAVRGTAPFSYQAVPAPAVGVHIRAEHVQQLWDALR